ncbi:MAG: hypothetical protein OXE99_08625 [Cellvibrionales bacterium]|nr:hypothetical protein [Cellvibrionales bacterium]
MSSQSSRFFYLALLPFLFLLFACDRSSNNQIDPMTEQEVIVLAGALYDEEYLPPSHVLITFSLSKKSQQAFDLYKLGLIDIVVLVDTGSEVIRHSLAGKLIPEDFHLNDAESIDLTRLNNAYHYYGFFDVPAGDLVAVEIAFSGSKSEIIYQGIPYRLIDSHFARYPSLKNTSPDNLNEQRFPLIVRKTLSDNIVFKQGNLTGLNIAIDAFESITKEAINTEDKNTHYALFSPQFRVTKHTQKGDFLTPIPLQINESNALFFSDGEPHALVLGELTTRLFAAEIETTSQSTFFLDGQAISDLSAIKGSFDIDITGTLSMNQAGYFYKIDTAYVDQFSSSDTKNLYEGRVLSVMPDKIRLAGKKFDLTDKNKAFLEGEAFIGDIQSTTQHLKKGHFIRLIQSSQGSQLIYQEAIQPNEMQVFDLYSSLAVDSDDLLNLKNNTEITQRISLHAPLPCSTFIENCQSDQAINTLDFSNAQGLHKVIVMGQGEVDENNGKLFFIKSKTQLKTYSDTEDLLATLVKQIQAGYRIYRVSGEGKQIGDIFEFSKDINLIALSPDLKKTPTSPALEGMIEINASKETLLHGQAVFENIQQKLKGLLKKVAETRFGISAINQINQTQPGLKKATLFSRTAGIKQKFSAFTTRQHQTNNSLKIHTATATTSSGNVVITAPMSEILASAEAERFKGAKTTKVYSAEQIMFQVQVISSKINPKLKPLSSITQTFPAPDQVKTAPSRITTLANTLTDALILSKVDTLWLAKLNPRIKAMSQEEFNATLDFRKNHSRLATLLTAAGLFPTEAAANEKIVSALNNITKESLHKGDIGTQAKQITDVAELSLASQKAKVSAIGNPKGIPTPPPPPPITQALKNNLSQEVTRVEKAVNAVSLDIAAELNQVKLKATPINSQNIDPVSALMTDIRSGKAQLKKATQPLLQAKEDSLKPNKLSVGELILNQINLRDFSDEAATSLTEEKDGNYAGASDDEWEAEEKHYAEKLEADEKQQKTALTAQDSNPLSKTIAIDDIDAKVSSDIHQQNDLKQKTVPPITSPDGQSPIQHEIHNRRKK